jgi:carbon-monoxide dehydrogenase large subunit
MTDLHEFRINTMQASVESIAAGSATHGGVAPLPTNSLGVKGVGEARTRGAAPCIMNAVVDALSGLGVQDIQMPASPLNVWNAIQQATGQQATGQQAQATNQENNA